MSSISVKQPSMTRVAGLTSSRSSFRSSGVSLRSAAKPVASRSGVEKLDSTVGVTLGPKEPSSTSTMSEAQQLQSSSNPPQPSVLLEPSANNSYMRASYNPAQPPKESTTKDAWSAKPIQPAASAPTPSAASFTSQQSAVENGFPGDSNSVASKLADLSVSEPPGMGMDSFGGDFGADFGGGFGAGFDSEPEISAPVPSSAPSLSNVPPPVPSSSGMDNSAGSFKNKGPPAGFQNTTPQYSYSQPTPPSVAPPPTPSEQPPVPEGAPPEKPSERLSAPLPDAPPPSDVPATQHAMPAYYGNVPGGMPGPYSFIGIPGMPGAPGYPPYDQNDQSDTTRSNTQYPNDPSGTGLSSGANIRPETAEDDKSGSSKNVGLMEGSTAPFPPSGPPPSTRTSTAPAATSAQARGPPPPQQAFTGMPHAAFAGMPPGVPGPQYGTMYPTYPYMAPNAGYHHYVHNPYNPYPPTPGAAYAPQAGSSTFSPAVVSSQYPGGPAPQGGPVKFQHGMGQYKPAPASGPQNSTPTAYGAGNYSSGQSGVYAQTPAASSAGSAYGSEDFGSTQMRGYKDSGLFIPGQQTQGANTTATSGAPTSGLEGSAPSSYSYGGYAQGQGGYNNQYAQYAAQGQYWQSQMMVQQQQQAGGNPQSNYNSKQML
mmetsp:Transcript_15575/g.18767  ORF Transcript_15575/g.18767 Transcript_15575/m.18767 type:complete len:651 (+) Transcript_15575:163-2115(+)